MSVLNRGAHRYSGDGLFLLLTVFGDLSELAMEVREAFEMLSGHVIVEQDYVHPGSGMV